MDQRRILVADDDPDIREVLRLYLENAGYAVVEAADGVEALEAIAAQRIDLCLLDIMMPRMDGYQALKRIRQENPMPVIIISAKGQDPEKILGLDLGADDYLVKPFNPLEAIARVRSNLRRVYELGTPDADDAVGESLRVRDLVLDIGACTLSCAGRNIELTPVELRIMTLLMEHPGRVFTKQQIYEHAWNEPYVAADNSVMVCMSKLRAKLSDDPAAYIATIRGLGYRMER